MSALRCWAAIWSCLILASASSRAFCSAFSRMTTTVLARSPISSPRLAPGITTSRLPPAISPSAPFRRIIGRAMPRKENTIDAINARMTMTAMIWLTRLACAVSATTSSLRRRRILLRVVDRRFHQIGGVGDNLDGAVGDDIGLQLLALDDLVIGGEEALDDLIQRADHGQQFAVVGLAAQQVEIGLERGLGLGDLGDQAGIAGGAEPPDHGPQRVHLGIGLMQQLFDLGAIVELGQRRRSQLRSRSPWSIHSRSPSACRSAPAAWSGLSPDLPPPPRNCPSSDLIFARRSLVSAFWRSPARSPVAWLRMP